MEPVLELRGITKRFPGVLANDQISLTLNRGEIHALLGENGAGKSTLMNILYGLYRPDEGEILVNGKKLEVSSPRDAINAGVGMVHQHFMLIPVFTVTENVMLGDEEILTADLLDRRKAANRIQEISREYNLAVDPDSYVRDLPVGLQQRVEIIKLLYRNADILILDEPTAVLTPQEVTEFFTIVKTLTAQGKSIIFITHKLGEVMDFADRITVIRAGKVVGTTVPAETDTHQLAAMMVGRDIAQDLPRQPFEPGEAVLEVHDLQVLNSLHQLAVDWIHFSVHAGEILGVAGVQGNGQTELVRALTGLTPPVGGNVLLLGREITHSSPRRITRAGTAHIPEDRQLDGLVLTYSVEDNLILNTWDEEPFAHAGLLQPQAIEDFAYRQIENFDIRTPSAKVRARNLSGGNQQKVIVAREFSRPIHLLVAAQPTRGLDVGSIEYIHQRILQKRDEGCAVLLVSTELDEIFQLSDRIAVMYRGKLLSILDTRTATREQVGLLMAGISEEHAHV